MEIWLRQLVTIVFISSVSVAVSSTTTSQTESTNNERGQLQFQVERIETDLKVFRMGANIDFSYNETSDFEDEVVSSPGCPKSHEGRPWVYYGSPPKCYLVGFLGPCPLGKRMFYVTKSKYGVCNCECFTQVTFRQSSPQVSPPSPHAIVDYDKYDISQNLILYPRRRTRSHFISQARNVRNSPLGLRSYLKKRPCNFTETTTTELPTTTTESPKNDDNLEITSYLLPKTGPSTKGKKDRYKFCYSDWYNRMVVYDSLRQECTPFLDRGPCQKEEWLVRDMGKENGVTCEPRKCPEITGVDMKLEYGGSFSYFDYRRQACFTEVFGNLQESFFANSGGIIPGSNIRFCRDAGMRYSQRLKTCVRDISKQFQYSVVG